MATHLNVNAAQTTDNFIYLHAEKFLLCEPFSKNLTSDFGTDNKFEYA